LVENLQQQGLRLAKHAPRSLGSDPGRSYRYIIEEAPDGLCAHTAFLLFPANSDDDKNRLSCQGINLASVYNPHCKTAMFYPGLSGPADSVHRERLARLQSEDSDVFRLFKGFRP
jgi:hypothetical protein